MEYRFKVFIHPSPMGLGTDIYIVEERGGKAYVAKPLGPLVFEEVKNDGTDSATLRFGKEANGILKAFAEAASLNGFPTELEAKTIGTLNATKKHLEDMRALVFKSRPEEARP